MRTTGSRTPPEPAHDDALRRRVGALVRDIADGEGAAERAARPQDPDILLTALDSLHLVHLLTRLEAEFGIAVPARQVVRENFTSVTALCALITSLAPLRDQEAQRG